MGLFGKNVTERTRAWAADVRASFSDGGLSYYEGGAPVSRAAATYTVNGVPPHIEAIWSYWDAVGDFHAGGKFFAACLSRCTLRLGVRDIDNNIGPAFDENGDPLAGVPVRLAKLGAKMIASIGTAPGMVTSDGPVGGHSMILGNIGKHLYSTSVCWLVAKKTPTGDNWEVLSTSELVPLPTEKEGEKQRFKRRRHYGGTWEEWTPDFYLRIFDPHPRSSGDPDSSAVPLLSILERIALLDAEGLADSKSRLKGPGILWVPSEMDFPATDEDPEGDKYLQRELIATASIGIKDPSSASRHVPLVVGAAGDQIKNVVHQRFDYDGEQLIQKRGAAMGDLARGVPLPYEAVTGYGECVDTETEILTDRGWLRYDDVTAGDETLTLNHDTGLSEWQVIERVSRFPAVNLPMMALKGRSHSSLSTMNHRWPVVTQNGKRRWKFSADLNTSDRIIPAAPSADLPADPKWSDAFVEAVAWLWTDGCVNERSTYICQSQKTNPSKVATIRRTLTELFGPPSEKLYASSRHEQTCTFEGCEDTMHGHGLCTAHRHQARKGQALRPVQRIKPITPPSVAFPAWRESPPTAQDGLVVFHLNWLARAELLVACPDKVVTQEFLRSLTRAQLELFIQTSVDGDGIRRSDGGLVLYQEDERRTAAFELACILSGRAVSRRERRTTGRYGDVVQSQIVKRRPGPMRIGFGIKREEVLYTGEIWCPTVQNGTWLARREGKVYFTGNTSMANAFAIDEQLVRIYAMPPLDLITGFLTGGWFTNALMLATGQKLGEPPTEDIRRLCVWYDVAGLVNAPDPAKLAQWAFGTDTNPNSLISRKGARRLVGIPEGEAPSDEEISERIEQAQKLRARSEKGSDEARPDGDGDDPMPDDRQDGERDKDEEIGKRTVAVARTVIELAVAQAGNKLRSKVSKHPDLLARIDGVDAADVARVLGPAVIESLGGTGPLLNGTFVAFERTVLREFVDAGRADAADLASAATNMAKRATLARLTNPAARLDARTASDFIDMLIAGGHA